MLFDASDLTNLLGYPVPEEKAQVAERIVWGWLRPILGVEHQPQLAAPELFSWAVELGAIVVENPAGLTAYQLGEERFAYSAERRGEILAEVSSSALAADIDGDGVTGVTPRGSFPAASDWPDPACGW